MPVFASSLIILKARSRVVIFGYEIRNNENDVLLATGETSHLITGHDMQPRSLPEKYKVMFGL